MAADRGHGWVRPIEEGKVRAKCGGPAMCKPCADEQDDVVTEHLARIFMDVLQAVGNGTDFTTHHDDKRSTRRRLVELAGRALAEINLVADDVDPLASQALGPMHMQALIYVERLDEVLASMVVYDPKGEHTLADVYGQQLAAVREHVEHHWRYLLAAMMNKPAQMEVPNGQG